MNLLRQNLSRYPPPQWRFRINAWWICYFHSTSGSHTSSNNDGKTFCFWGGSNNTGWSVNWWVWWRPRSD
jgi:hypothetical protein